MAHERLMNGSFLEVDEGPLARMGGKYHDRFDRTRSILKRLRKATEEWCEAGAGERVANMAMKDAWYIKRFTWTGHKLNVVVRKSSSEEEYIVAVTPYDVAEMGKREKEAADATS